MTRRAFWWTGLVVVLLLAGGLSYYASANPDGLEFVAEQAGFADTARDSATADGPLADYRTRGVDDARLSGGFAGVIGALAVLVLTGGLAFAVRRRGDAAQAD